MRSRTKVGTALVLGTLLIPGVNAHTVSDATGAKASAPPGATGDLTDRLHLEIAPHSIPAPLVRWRPPGGLSLPEGQPVAGIAGDVRMYAIADNEFAAYFPMQQWIASHFERMQTYAPWFDPETAWYPGALEYKDLYAIYNCADFGPCHPINQALFDAAMSAENDPEIADWIIKDSNGNQLYLGHKCEQGVCGQYAADITNPDFRAFWIDQMLDSLAGGDYAGVFVDDVNLDARYALSDGFYCTLALPGCNWSVPFDPSLWAGWVADFMEQIRGAIPSYEIAINPVWYHVNLTDTELPRVVDTADYVMIERGFNDPNIQPGLVWDWLGRPRGFDNLLAFSDYLHSRGRSIIHFNYIHAVWTSSANGEDLPLVTRVDPFRQLEYGLAAWFLTSNGDDLFGSKQNATPADWWHGFDISLGAAVGSRVALPGGLYRRDFADGIVLLRGPGQGLPTRINLPSTMYTIDDEAVDEVTLEWQSAKILRFDGGSIDSLETPRE